MKKFIILLAIVLITSVSYSQGTFRANREVKEAIPAYTMDGDTAWIFTMTEPYIMQFGYDWTGATATDAYINVYFSYDGGSNYVKSTYDSIPLTAATGSKIYQDLYYINADKVKVDYVNGTNTAGTLNINLRFIKK